MKTTLCSLRSYILYFSTNWWLFLFLVSSQLVIFLANIWIRLCDEMPGRKNNFLTTDWKKSCSHLKCQRGSISDFIFPVCSLWFPFTLICEITFLFFMHHVPFLNFMSYFLSHFLSIMITVTHLFLEIFSVILENYATLFWNCIFIFRDERWKKKSTSVFSSIL